MNVNENKVSNDNKMCQWRCLRWTNKVAVSREGVTAIRPFFTGVSISQEQNQQGKDLQTIVMLLEKLEMFE